jgi:hypothetical protein
MDSMVGLILSQLGSGAIQQISQQMGIDENKAQQAVGMALPLIIGALNRNASSTDGAQALTSALQRDHDGSILEDLAGALTKPETLDDGTAILKHVLGDNKGSVMTSVGKATKLDAEQIAQIFAILAPIVMGALGQMQRKKELDAKGVSAVLQGERTSMEKATSGITQLLDFNGDGDVSEEIISLGSSLLGGLLGK